MTGPDTAETLPHPRAMSELTGHAAAERAVLDAWTQDRMHHAWLIQGPRGIGKATLAYRIARFVLAGGGAEEGAGLFGEAAPVASLAVAPDHPVFRRIASESHGDLKAIERVWDDKKKPPRRKSEITVDQVRGVGTFLSMTSAEGGWRVVIIDAADEMNRNAANAILKVLEEPPRNALLLLVAHNPGRLLPTIRSRCRRLTLTRLADEQVRGLIDRLRPDLPTEDANALARLGEGSVGRALGLAEQGGLTLYREMAGLLTGLPRLDIPALHAFADKINRPDDSFATASALLSWWVARAIRAGATADLPDDVVPGEGEAIRRMMGLDDGARHGPAWGGLDRWVQTWEKITQSFDRAEAVNLDKKQVMLGAFLALERQARS